MYLTEKPSLYMVYEPSSHWRHGEVAWQTPGGRSGCHLCWWAAVGGLRAGLELFVLKESWLMALVYFTRGTPGVPPGSHRTRFLVLRFSAFN